MYVCVCKAVTDTQIKNAIGNGHCTHKQLVKCLGVGGDCGKCHRHIKELLKSNPIHQSVAHEGSNQPILLAC
ncbi:MAG: (2Fe-2S)-binding protein [Methylococcaceae bacterium]